MLPAIFCLFVLFALCSKIYNALFKIPVVIKA